MFNDESSHSSSNSSRSTEEYKQILEEKLGDLAESEERSYADGDYFTKLFPVETVSALLGEDLRNRRFAFAYRNGNNMFWEGYQSFGSAEELHNFLRERKPIRVDVGGRGTEPPHVWRLRDRQRKQMQDPDHHRWMWKELVVDVDLKDVALRTCKCAGADAPDKRCPKCGRSTRNFYDESKEAYCTCRWDKFHDKLCHMCWNFAQVHVSILDYIFRNIWGFRQFHFVFSGGKGFHCWILDEAACQFTLDDRARFVESLQPWTDPATPTHLKDEHSLQDPIFGKDFDIFVLPLFEEKILKTNIFKTTHFNTQRLFAHVISIDINETERDEAFEEMLNQCMLKKTSTEEWELLMRWVFDMHDRHTATIIQRRLVYAYVFPVLDARITTDMKHLLKIPFSLHPGSGFISIPLTVTAFYNFSPSDCPHIEKHPNVLLNHVENFTMLTALMQPKLTAIFYCKKGPLGEIKNNGWHIKSRQGIIAELYQLLDRCICRKDLFHTEALYRKHSQRCQCCDSHMLLYRENTLDQWIGRLAWVNGSHELHIDVAVRVSMLKYLKKRRLIELSPETEQSIHLYESV